MMIYAYLACIVAGTAIFVYCLGLLVVRRKMLKTHSELIEAGVEPRDTPSWYQSIFKRPF